MKMQRAELASKPSEGQLQIAQESSPPALAAEPEGHRIIAHRQGFATASGATSWDRAPAMPSCTLHASSSCSGTRLNSEERHYKEN